MSIETESVVYQGPGGPFEGTVSWDASVEGQRPGVLVSHAYGGQGEFDTEKAEALAALGYLGFAIDMYGQGKRASSEDGASALMATLVSDRPLLSERINRAHAVLKDMDLVDDARTGAIGFCFGGRCVLDLARSGSDVLGVASFHGIYDAPEPALVAPITSSVLVLHGWDDPLATPDAVVALGSELTERNADWQVLAFGNTNHAFTNPNAQSAETGMLYNPLSTGRGWKVMADFFDALFV